MYNIRKDVKRLEDQIQGCMDYCEELRAVLFIMGFIFILLILFVIFFYNKCEQLNNTMINKNMNEYVEYDLFTCINENESIDNIISMDYDYDNKVDPNNIYIHSVNGKTYNYEYDKCKKDNLYFKKNKSELEANK